jgi:hypothetical protein
MRPFSVMVSLMGLLGACARTSCGPDTARDSQRERGVGKGVSAGQPSAELRSETAISSKELRVLDKIRARRKGANVRYLSPGASELEDFGGWFRSVVAAAESNVLTTQMAPTGFELDSSEAPIWIVGEQATHQRGAGAFVVRAGPAANWVVQAPHTFFDVGTLEIALACFDALNARALFVNTVRRSTSSDSSDEHLEHDERADLARSGEGDADLAHLPSSFFSTAHATFLQSATSYSTLQIHGFRDELLPQVSVVVSAAGTKASADAIAAGLRSTLGNDAVLLYPSQVKKLGGTRNVQARLSKAAGSVFVHLELSRSLRDRLKADPELRRAFAMALKAGALPSAR